MLEKGTKIWFKDGPMTNGIGIIEGWVYDIWYKVWELEKKKYHFVLPEEIVKIIA